MGYTTRRRSPSLDDAIGSWEVDGGNSPSSSAGVPHGHPLTQFTPPESTVDPPVSGLSFQPNSQGVLPSPPPSADRSQLSDYDYGSRQGSNQDGSHPQDGSHHQRSNPDGSHHSYDGSYHHSHHGSNHQGSHHGSNHQGSHHSNHGSHHSRNSGASDSYLGSHLSRSSGTSNSYRSSHQDGSHLSRSSGASNSYRGSHQDGPHHSRRSGSSNLYHGSHHQFHHSRRSDNIRVSFEPESMPQPCRRPPPPLSFLRTHANGYRYDSNHTQGDWRPQPTNYCSSSMSSSSRFNHHQEQSPQNYDTDYHSPGSNRRSSDFYSHHSNDDRNGGY
jgi:hypothetical protein